MTNHPEQIATNLDQRSSSENIHSRPVKLNPMVPLNSDDSSVAVIAIHGVGQHVSGASADAVSTLLLSIGRTGVGKVNKGKTDNGPKNETEENPDAFRPYSGFQATSIDVPLRPVQSPPDDAGVANDRHQRSWLSRIWGIFDERRGYLAAAREPALRPAIPKTSRALHALSRQLTF